MLSVTELGVSTAIVYHLYSALVSRDERQIERGRGDVSVQQQELFGIMLAGAVVGGGEPGAAELFLFHFYSSV